MKLTTSKSFFTVLGVLAISATMTWSKPSFACSGTEPMLGSLCIFGGNFAPRNYAMAQGQLLPISSNSALFSLLGTTYGGDGRTTFALPDLRGRAAIGFGRGPGLTDYRLGQFGGVEAVALSVQQMPVHTHVPTTTATLNASAGSGAVNSAEGNALFSATRTDTGPTIYVTTAPNVAMKAGSVTVTTEIANTGGSQAHENRMPYLAMNYIIAMQGVFPSRQ